MYSRLAIIMFICTYNIYNISMEKYLLNYDNLQKKLVFKFGRTQGGIGDLTIYFLYLLRLCIDNNIKLYYLLLNNSVDDFIKIKYEQMYITPDKITNPVYIKNINELLNTQANTLYIIEPERLHSVHNVREMLPCLGQDLFYFTDEVKMKADLFIHNSNITNYISIHLRLGDKFLETDVNYVRCPNDVRQYNETNLCNVIEQNADKNIIFFCDNNTYKLKMKDKYKFIHITDYAIGHTSLTNTTDLQVLNAITEFYLLTNSDHIYGASYSGFSFMASKMKNVPLSYI